MTKRLLLAGLSLALLYGCPGSTLVNADDATTVSSTRRTPIVIAIERVRRSSVNIHSEKRAKPTDVLFSAGKDRKVNGMGTGIIIDERGYIATNYHVIQDVDTLRVTLFNGSAYDARPVSFDSRRDLAIIKIEPRETLDVMPTGTSSDLMLGEDVVAIGNAFGYADTVTRGVISALDRDVEVNDDQSYEDLIQIDAAINPGNSGGPLLNADGELVGINVAIRAGAQKIGFAIPIDDARKTIAKLLNIERLNNHYHGLQLTDVKEGRRRELVVDGAVASSPAAAAGLKPGDVIVKAGELTIVDSADLERALLGHATGEKIEIQVRRGAAVETVALAIADLAPERATPARQYVAAAPPAPVKVPTADGGADKSWNLLGIKLNTLQDGDTALSGQPYHGGLVVSDVRSDSPAARNGIRSGDILVGLHVWETVNQENIDYVVNHPQLTTFSPLKFYILRDGETLYGHFQVSGIEQSTIR